jgi:hypothetical protein
VKSLLMKCHLTSFHSTDPLLKYTEHLKLASSRDSGMTLYTASHPAVARAKELFQDGFEVLHGIATTATQLRKLGPWAASLTVRCEIVSQRLGRTGTRGDS